MYDHFKLKPIKEKESVNEGIVMTFVLGVVIAKTILKQIIKSFRLNKKAELFVSDSVLVKAQLPYWTICKTKNVSDLTTLDKLQRTIEDFCYRNAEIVPSKEEGITYVIVDNPSKKYSVYANLKTGNQLIDSFELRDINSEDTKVVTRKEYENRAIKENSQVVEYKKIANKFMLKRVFQMYTNLFLHPFSFSKPEILQKDLLKLVKSCKSQKEVDYLRKDLSAAKNQLKGTISILNMKGKTKKAKLLEDHINWIDTVYKQALSDKRKELKKNINEMNLELIDENYISSLNINSIETLKEESKMSSNHLSKSYIDSHLYKLNAPYYEKSLINFILKGKEVDKFDESFKIIESDIKRRQTDSSILKLLQSKNIVLMISGNNVPLPRSFKVFVASDIRAGEEKRKKVFIDVSGIITFTNNEYKCNQRNIDILLAYLISAGTQYIYFADPKRLIMNRSIIESGAYCFSKLFTYVIDYLAKISVNGNLKNKVLYISSLYYIKVILNKDITESALKLARDISGLNEREGQLTMMQFEEENLKNIQTLISGLQNIIKKEDLTLDVVVNKWVFLYGMGTQFALELFSAFSTMITNAYNGQFLNNQASIEKQCGTDMVKFCKEGIMKIINESV